MPPPNTNTYTDLANGRTAIRTRSGHVFLIDTADVEVAKRHSWVRHAHGYARAGTRAGGKQKAIYLHRILCPTTAERPHVDHVNGDTADCRRANLRPCSRSENLRNQKRRADNATGFKGVGLHRQTGKYRARVRANGVVVDCGLFETAQQAAGVVEAQRELLHREFCRHE